MKCINAIDDDTERLYITKYFATIAALPTRQWGRMIKTMKTGNTAYKAAAGLALTAAFLIVWLNAAAGLIGIEDDDPANLLYVGVLAIGFIGAIIARLQPLGLARTLYATALAQTFVGAIALTLPNTASSMQIVILHGVFVALFLGSASLFRHAARANPAACAGSVGTPGLQDE
jgi:hypothetical protein